MGRARRGRDREVSYDVYWWNPDNFTLVESGAVTVGTHEEAYDLFVKKISEGCGCTMETSR